ncbi:hypothetical protein [Nostoc sp. UHCC 0870]|uniref:hypothetical protein n=1 Tax=Nostoc sp. UHCC 0870 TaxID=2914041 RepID=UPI001EDF32F7|nr:hypothetical protein [Nostoc sp. UHCC 0870]UKO99925.1 hypothetical protein L6494_09550 [Nostoc sp. UHCC 0870]
MSTKVITSDLFVPLSTDEQQLLSGGQRSFGGGSDGDQWRRRYFSLRRCVRRCLRF